MKFKIKYFKIILASYFLPHATITFFCALSQLSTLEEVMLANGYVDTCFGPVEGLISEKIEL